MKGNVRFANVVSLLALFVALGGGAYAAKQITGDDIKHHSIEARNLAAGLIHCKKLHSYLKDLLCGPDATIYEHEHGSSDGTTGPPGPVGPPGPPGPAGSGADNWIYAVHTNDLLPGGLRIDNNTAIPFTDSRKMGIDHDEAQDSPDLIVHDDGFYQVTATVSILEIGLGAGLTALEVTADGRSTGVAANNINVGAQTTISGVIRIDDPANPDEPGEPQVAFGNYAAANPVSVNLSVPSDALSITLAPSRAVDFTMVQIDGDLTPAQG